MALLLSFAAAYRLSTRRGPEGRKQLQHVRVIPKCNMMILLNVDSYVTNCMIVPAVII